MKSIVFYMPSVYFLWELATALHWPSMSKLESLINGPASSCSLHLRSQWAITTTYSAPILHLPPSPYTTQVTADCTSLITTKNRLLQFAVAVQWRSSIPRLGSWLVFCAIIFIYGNQTLDQYCKSIMQRTYMTCDTLEACTWQCDMCKNNFVLLTKREIYPSVTSIYLKCFESKDEKM